jgi:hypothetical protein
MPDEKELLVPVQVPWMISPSVPYLCFGAQETGRPLTATFIGFFKCEAAGRPPAPGIRKVGDPGPFIPSEHAKGAEYRLVQVEFEQAFASRRSPSFSDTQVVEEGAYDWSLVPNMPLPGEAIKDFLVRVEKIWLSTGQTPDPGMYEVRRSRQLQSAGLPEGEWHHYLMLGHDEYLEVVARSWSWRPGQPVE